MAKVSIGVNALIQSDYGSPSNSNLEALVLVSGEVVHLWNDFGDQLPWRSPGAIASGCIHPPALVRADYPGGADHANFEALLVMQDGGLQHWWRDNDADPSTWKVGHLGITSGVTAAPSLAVGALRSVKRSGTRLVWVCNDSKHKDFGRSSTQSSCPRGNFEQRTTTWTETADHRDFEALVPKADGLWHWSRDNLADMQWLQRGRVTEHPGAVGCLILGDYSDNLEALVYEPWLDSGHGSLTHFWFDGVWHRGVVLTDRAVGAAALIQSDYAKGADHHNLEALIPEVDAGAALVRHWYRDNSHGGSWKVASGNLASIAGPDVEVTLIQGNLGGHPDHGNLEGFIVSGAGDLEHVWRNAEDMAWGSGGRAYPPAP